MLGEKTMCLDNKMLKEEKSLYTDKSNIHLRRRKRKMSTMGKILDESKMGPSLPRGPVIKE